MVLSFRELAVRADRLAARLSVSPGERVALVASNVPAVVVALFAVWKVGAVAVPLSARLRRFELQRAFDDAEPAAVVSIGAGTGSQLRDELAALAELTPTLAAGLVLNELGDVLEETRSGAVARTDPLSSELAAIMYTSGTTGDPKGALVSHALVAATGWQLAERLGPSADRACGLVVPVTHAFGFGCLLASLTAGGLTVFVDSTTSLAPLVQAIHRHEGQVLHGTPSLWASVLRAGAELSVRTGFTAGSACPPELLIELERRGMRILNVYGMTEIGAATACSWEDPAETRYRTVGRPLSGYEFRVVPDAHGRDEIQVRSPLISPEYHRRPWSNEEAGGDGWFRTGDLGAIDPAGNVVIGGRAKEVVHVGGFNVFPAEVENFLLTNPDIAQAAVIGVPHPVMGEAVKAFVVPTRDAQLEPADVVRFARAGIAGYKIPYSVVLVDELPLLASGKPDRRALARAVEGEQVRA